MHNLGAKYTQRNPTVRNDTTFQKKSFHKFSISFVHPAKRSKQNLFRCKSNQLLIQQKKFRRRIKIRKCCSFRPISKQRKFDKNVSVSEKNFCLNRKMQFQFRKKVSLKSFSFCKSGKASWQLNRNQYDQMLK